MLVISRKKRLIILVLVVVSVVILFLIYWQKEKEVSSTGKDEEKEEVPLLSVKGVSLVGWNEDGEKSWKVEADSGVQFSDRMALKEVKFYLLKEDVVLVSYLDGTQLFTSEMEWITSERKLETGEEVVIKRNNIIVEGLGLTANPDLSQIEIKSRAVTKFVENNQQVDEQ